MPLLSAEQQAESLIDHIAFRIRTLRAQEGLLQGELAQRCGLRQQTISKLENGDYRRNEFIVSTLKVSAYFQVDPAIFFFGHTNLTPEALSVAQLWENAPENLRNSVYLLLTAVS
jgi:transcriptional regulator with XRE-family HTH domain